jgi:hypothetical protein
MAVLSASSARRRHTASAGLALALWLCAVVPAMAAQANLEYAVKATYLFKFIPFVEWPATASATPATPFVICVIGEDPFGPVLAQTVSGQQAHGHPIVIEHAAAYTTGMNCQELFVGRGPTADAAFRAADSQAVLTVSDNAPGADGAIIHFVVKDGHVRFDIDPAAAQRNGITISSKLLDLAQSYRKAR